MVNRAAFLLLIIFSFALVNCGGESEKPAGKIGEEIGAEKALEKTAKPTSGKVDVNVSDKTIQIKSQDDNVTLSGSKNVNLSSSFPGDIPIYNGAKIIHSMESNQEKAFNVSLATKDDQATVTEYYKSAMKSQGWGEKGSMEVQKQQVLTYVKGDRNANILIVSGEGQTKIIITITKQK